MIRRVATSFVPVAVNLYKTRQAKDPGGELFRSVQRQKDQYQGIWVISPAGKVLAGHHEIKSHETWTQEVLETADAALKTFGPVSPRQVNATNPLPSRGHGVQPDGSVCLAIHARQMLGGGRQAVPAGVPDSRLWLWDGTLRRDGPTVIDSLTLDAEQWSAVSPPKTEPGTTWSVPDSVARQFCRVLVPSSDQSAMPRPADAKLARLTATVESVEGERVRIRLTGAWDAVHLIEGDATRPIRGTATADGFAVYDLSRKSLQSLLLVFSGTYGRPNDDSVCATGAVAEWQRERESNTSTPCADFDTRSVPATLVADEAKPNTLTEDEKKAGWKLLFDGKTTEGWRGYKMKELPPGWKAIDGVLARVSGGAGGKGAGGGDDIVTVEQFDSFELAIDWKIAAGGNSGSLYHVSEDAETSWHVAPEMQVLDNTKYPNRSKKELAGACYDLYAPTKDVTRPVGEWNQARLVVNGNHVEHWLNGEKIVTYELGSDDWNARVAASKFKDKPKFAQQRKGFICLQDHSDRIEFRNIKIRRLPGGAQK